MSISKLSAIVELLIFFISEQFDIQTQTDNNESQN